MPDPLDALRVPVVPVAPRPQFAAALLRRIQGQPDPAAGRGATVRYFVTDLDTAVAFYRDFLGFEEELRPSPTFAMLYRGDLRLLLSVPGGTGEGDAGRDAQGPAPVPEPAPGTPGVQPPARAPEPAPGTPGAQPPARAPEPAPGTPGAARPVPAPEPGPGGWNRIALQVTDLSGTVGELRRWGARFRSTVLGGVAIRRVLLEDPAGNLVELFEPTAGYHERNPGPAG